MIKDALVKLADRTDLSAQEAETVMLEIMDGAATSAQMAAYLMGLRQKGETVAEVVGSVSAMRSRATRIRVGSSIVVDTCGTGGDGSNTFEYLHDCGIRRCRGRHYRGQTRESLRLLSLRQRGRTEHARCEDRPRAEPRGDCIDEVGVGFLFAPLYHGAMKQCAGVRQEMGIRTILNVLGPLANPAGATHQVLGVYDAKWTEILGRVLLELGSQHCFVTHGLDGLDEVTLSDRTKVSEGKGGVVRVILSRRRNLRFGVRREKNSSAARRRKTHGSRKKFFRDGKGRDGISCV